MRVIKYPKIHPRVKIVDKALRGIKESILEHIKPLTTAETVQVVTRALSDELVSIAKYAIREERHGDASEPGDWA